MSDVVKTEQPEIKTEQPEIKTEQIIKNVVNPIFCQLLVKYLSKSLDNIETLSIKVSPEMQQYFLKLCSENVSDLNEIDSMLYKIIADNQINVKDIPTLINLVKKIYDITKKHKKRPSVDPYDLIKSFLNIVFVVYIETNKIQNNRLVEDLLKIIDVSMDLIQSKPFNYKKGKKGGLFGLF